MLVYEEVNCGSCLNTLLLSSQYCSTRNPVGLLLCQRNGAQEPKSAVRNNWPSLCGQERRNDAGSFNYFFIKTMQNRAVLFLCCIGYSGLQSAAAWLVVKKNRNQYAKWCRITHICMTETWLGYAGNGFEQIFGKESVGSTFTDCTAFTRYRSVKMRTEPCEHSLCVNRRLENQSFLCIATTDNLRWQPLPETACQ